jgi:prephenate dehydratase
MHIYYQWYSWAYWNKASLQVAWNLRIKTDKIIWVDTFKKVFNEIDQWNIWVLPIENSYAWSIHENFYHIISWNYYIFWEIYLDINHFLLWKNSDISKIKKAYSHPQALMQCQNYLKKYNIEPIVASDTAWAAKYVSQTNDESIASISSNLCSEMYWLEIIDKNIQDQTWNTTRFFVVCREDIFAHKKEKFLIPKTWKISIQFKAKNIPSSLYKCLWAFATRYINLTKIESIPAKENCFEYIFWIDLEKNVEEKILCDAFDELKFFCTDFKILWDY